MRRAPGPADGPGADLAHLVAAWGDLPTERSGRVSRQSLGGHAEGLTPCLHARTFRSFEGSCMGTCKSVDLYGQ